MAPASPGDPAILTLQGDDDPREGRAADGRRHNLPHTPSGFVGRRQELADLSALLGESRLVTVIGPGGVGKTRLALRAAARAASRFPDGVWLAELASVSDPGRLVDAVAASLPSSDLPSGARSAEALAAHIGDREMLLVLDSCERLVDACAQVAELLLRSCPALGILATSREPLGISGEHISALGPLSLPGPHEVDAESVQASEAGELFLRRAAATSAGFALTESTAPVVWEICRRLDAVPLAIELAAARLTSLSAADILDRLDDRLTLLNTGSRTADPRHQTLAADLEWSHDLLTPAQATLLRRLAVFAGWTIDAAEAVCPGDDLLRADVVDLLSALVNKSLVVREKGDDRVRYHLLETIRLWAATKLDAAPEAADVHRRHAKWCLGLAERVEDDLLTGRLQPSLDRLNAERENLYAALEWARSADEAALGVRLATALVPFWRARGEIHEGVAWLDWAIVAAADGPTLLHAKALKGAGLLHGLLGDIGSALPLLERSAALSTDEDHDDAGACNCNPMTRMFRNPRQALPDLEERISFCRRTGDTKGLTHLFLTAGQAHFFLGEAAPARMHFEELVRLGREAADGEALRCGLFGLARVAFLLGDFAEAKTNASEARALAEAEGDLEDTGTALALLGDLARARGQWDEARHLLDTSERMARATSSPSSIARALYLRARLAEWTGEHGPNELEALYDKALTLGRACGAPGFHEMRCLIGVGSAKRAGGNPTAAAGYILEALEKAQALGDPQATAMAFDYLSALAGMQGKADEASMLAHRGLELHHRIGELQAVVSSLELLAGLAADAGRHELATRMLGSAQAARDTHGYARSTGEQLRHDACVDTLAAALGKKAFAATWAEGLASSPDEAVGYALRGAGAVTDPRPAGKA